MVVGEGALALHGGDDRNPRQLGERPEFGAGVGVQHALSGPDDGPAGREQRAHGVLDVAASGHGAHRGRWPVAFGGAGRHLLAEDVAVHFHHDRSGATLPRGVEGAPNLRADPVDAVDGERQLRDGRVALRGREVRLHVVAADAAAPRQEDQRHGFAPGLRDAAEGVLHPGPGLGGEHADGLPARLAAIAVRRVDGAALLPEHEGPYPDAGDGLDQGICGKARHPGDAFGLHAVGDQVVTVHGVPSGAGSNGRVYRMRRARTGGASSTWCYSGVRIRTDTFPPFSAGAENPYRA